MVRQVNPKISSVLEEMKLVLHVSTVFQTTEGFSNCCKSQVIFLISPLLVNKYADTNTYKDSLTIMPSEQPQYQLFAIMDL